MPGCHDDSIFRVPGNPQKNRRPFGTIASWGWTIHPSSQRFAPMGPVLATKAGNDGVRGDADATRVKDRHHFLSTAIDDEC